MAISSWIKGVAVGVLLAVPGLAVGQTPGSLLWVRQNSSATTHPYSVSGFSNDVVIDNGGNRYVVGSYMGLGSPLDTVQAGVIFNLGTPSADTLTTVDGSDGFLAKYDPTGVLVWVRTMGGPSDDSANRVRLGSDGDLYLTGSFGGVYYGRQDSIGKPITFGRGEPTETTLQSAGRFDVFAARYTRDGEFVWAQRAGGPLEDFVLDMTFTPSGEPLLIGRFSGVTTLSGQPEQTVPGQEKDNLIRIGYTATGALSEVTPLGAYEDHSSVALLPSGEWVTAGLFGGSYFYVNGEAPGGNRTFSVDGQPVTLTSVGGRDIYVAHHQATGNLRWVRWIVGSRGDEEHPAVQVDAAGAIYLYGLYGWISHTFVAGAPATVGAGEQTEVVSPNEGRAEGFLAKLDPTGTLAWARRFGGFYEEYPNRLAFDAQGGVTVAGNYGRGQLKVDGRSPPLRNAGNQDLFVASYTGAGELRWAQRAGGGIDEGAGALAVSPDGTTVTVVGIMSANLATNPDYPSIYGEGEPTETRLKLRGNYNSIVATYQAGEPLAIRSAAPAQDGYRLSPAAPNPFNPATRLDLTLPRSADVSAALYDGLGRRVRLLLTGTTLPAGTHPLTVEAGDLPSGMYLIRVVATDGAGAGHIVTSRVTLLR